MSDKLKVLLTFGTRPEAIKMAPLIHGLKKNSLIFETFVCITAQHRQMLDQVLKVFEITPDIDLNLMTAGQDLFDVTGSVLMSMRDVLREFNPDVLLVHGDTTTTLASAMAGFYQNIPIGHIEAGLRTYKIDSPFPEEFNRQIVSKIARWNFAPTELSRDNLLTERVLNNSIFVTGNTVIDALHWVLNRIDCSSIKKQEIHDLLSSQLLFDWANSDFVLITGHRRENFGNGFLQICYALKELAFRFPKVNFVYPVHLNPNVQIPVASILSGLNNIHLIAPLDYEPFVYLLKHCYLVLTDSGGIQEEAPSLGKPVLVMREVTERPEAVVAGTVRLVGTNQELIINNVTELLNDKVTYQNMSLAHNPYGDGKACDRIIEVLRNI